ncbi:hypothetical protein FRC04_007233 [Tulasnella sp. 424]|nr:hypothetical protein FRC04_007233 [Tulasnella sp. 424]
MSTVGTFNTQDVHLGPSTQPQTSKTINFPKTYVAPPHLAIGLNALDVKPGKAAIVRVKAYADGIDTQKCIMHAETWDGGLGIILVSGIPAMYRLGLLSIQPIRRHRKTLRPNHRRRLLWCRLRHPAPQILCHPSKARLTNFQCSGGLALSLLRTMAGTSTFFGAGMLSGLNAPWSFLGGSILAWGIIAPALIVTGKAIAVDISDDKSMQAMKFKTFDDHLDAPSPRYWLLWPGVLIMLVCEYTLGMSSGSLIRAAGGLCTTIRNRIERYRNRNVPNAVYVDEDDNDPCPIGALALSMLLSLTLISTQFNVNVGEVILANIPGFIFSFSGIQSAGDTDINPISTVTRASRLILGGVAKGQGLAQVDGMRLNLVGGIVAGGAAAQSTDMTGDLKTGHLIGAKPKVQFVAQLVGSTVASFLTVGLFVLFTKASPCILYPPEDGVCAYGAPSVSAWAAVVTVVTAPKLPIPPSSGYTAIGLSILAAICVVVKHLWIPRKYWHWVPNWKAIGFGFVVPQITNPAQFDMYGFPFAAGLLAGEGLGGVVQALLTVAGVGGDGITRGTSVGCPGFEFCG